MSWNPFKQDEIQWIPLNLVGASFDEERQQRSLDRIDELKADEERLKRVKAIVFMRLNTAMDHRDHRAEKIYREIQEAMR